MNKGISRLSEVEDLMKSAQKEDVKIDNDPLARKIIKEYEKECATRKDKIINMRSATILLNVAGGTTIPRRYMSFETALHDTKVTNPKLEELRAEYIVRTLIL